MAIQEAQAKLLTNFSISRRFKLIDVTKLKDTGANFTVNTSIEVTVGRLIEFNQTPKLPSGSTLTASGNFSPADIEQNLDDLAVVSNFSLRLPTYVRIDIDALDLPVYENTTLSFTMESGFVYDDTNNFPPNPISGQDLFTISTPYKAVANLTGAFSPDITVAITATGIVMKAAVFTQETDTFFSRTRGIDKELIANTLIDTTANFNVDNNAAFDSQATMSSLVGVIKPLLVDPIVSIVSTNSVNYLRIREMNFDSDYSVNSSWFIDTFESRIRGVEADLTDAFSPTLDVNATFTTEIPFTVESTLNSDVVFTADCQADLLTSATLGIIPSYIFGVAPGTTFESITALNSTANFSNATLQPTTLTSEASIVAGEPTKVTYDTTANGKYNPNTILKPTLPIFGIQPAGVVVDWGDGTKTTTTTDGYIQHQYGTSGVYEIKIDGTFDRLGSLSGDPAPPGSPSEPYSQNVEGFVAFNEWGDHKIKSFNRLLGDWENVPSVPNIPSSITNLDRAFQARSADCSFVNNWDTSNVTSMNRMFDGAGALPNNLLGVDVSSVTDMGYMFSSADTTSTNKFVDMSNWNMSGVTNVVGMFAESNLSGGTEGWNLSSVTSLESMLSGAQNFSDNIGTWTITNSVTSMHRFLSLSFYNVVPAVGVVDLSGWDVSNVTDMSNAFASSNIDSVAGWDVSNVTNFKSTFSSAPADRIPDITFWNTSSATTMSSMFFGSSNNGLGFNQDISGWNVSNVTDFRNMFHGNNEFNQNISTWNTSSATIMDSMFEDASSFNQDLSSWCVELIPSEPTDFDTGATSWTLPRPNWGAPCA